MLSNRISLNQERSTIERSIFIKENNKNTLTSNLKKIEDELCSKVDISRISSYNIDNT